MENDHVKWSIMSTVESFDTIAISECKAHFLRLADQVARSGRPLVVTRHGRPLIELRPAAPPQRKSLKGSARQLVGDEEFMAPFPDVWNADLP
jgi:prevent-host-death family protein